MSTSASSLTLFYTPLSTPASSQENLFSSRFLSYPFFTIFGFHQKLDRNIKIIMISLTVLEVIPLVGACFTFFSSCIKLFGNLSKENKNLQDTSYMPIFYARAFLSLIGLGLVCLLIDLICTLVIYIANNITK